ncbi:hypothetical protein GWK18_07250 [Kocuria sp. JC486]|uniref:hypothetical protein n=1 Tax=Kocuria sp. JC486 TaxID=1970736 RepID=UPI0014202E9A|nr:hypothetical protein [Kocuria sp. JC486]NHU85388.1 hypothetical protein [Kocuria sp. JC486]
MARTFNPPPNWPKPPEGWEPPAGWQPDPAWGPAPEGWELWTDDDQESSTGSDTPSESAEPGADASKDGATGAGAATATGVGAAGGAAAGHAAPSFGGQDAGTGTSRMPQYQGGHEGPTAQSSTRGPEATLHDTHGGQYPGGQTTQYEAQGGAPQYQPAGGFGNYPPNGGGSGSTGGSGRSKLPWILGGVIALLLVVLLILVLALSGIFRGDDTDTTGDDQSQAQSSEEVSPGAMSTADASGTSAEDDPSVSDEATELNVEPENATEVKNPGEPVATFTEKDKNIEIPRPDGDDAPQLISVESTGDEYSYVTFDAEYKDGSEAFVTGASGSEVTYQLLNTYSFERGNPVTKIEPTEDDAKFEIKVYSLDDLQTVDGGNIKGDGNAVFMVDVADGSTWYKMSHNGSSNFIVYASIDYEDGTYGDQELAANEIGRQVVYTEYGEGKWLVSVDADGKWGFEESTEDMAREAAVADIMDD